uniref:Uncharacterized protein n=1 Tax=Petromyzon marinus TaxID=7757 RepID=S4RVU8_PETMA
AESVPRITPREIGHRTCKRAGYKAHACTP